MIKVGFDLDGVLYNFVSSIYNYCRLYRGMEISYGEFAKNPDELTGQDVMNYLVTVPTIYETGLPKQEDMESLHSLKNCEYFYITARPECVRLATEKFLAKNKFPDYQNLFMTKDKGVLSRLLQLNYYIDDMAKYVDKVSPTAKSFLLATPWNQKDREGRNVVSSIKEFISYIGAEND